MSIIYNGTNIENITYNGNNIDTVNYNNTEVFSGTKTLTVSKDNNIESIIINGNTYSSDTTLSIKSGTTVTLDCNLNSNTTSNGLTTTYSFYRWTGYSTKTSKSFTFTMPNQDITYTANGKSSESFSWPSSGNIPEATFLNGLNKRSYDTSLLGRTVKLTEDSSTHNWLIIRVNTATYDLWYKGSIGTAKWKGQETDRYWNNNSVNTTYVRGLCASYRSKLSSSIQAKLKTSLNANCSGTVVILSVKQLGYTGTDIENDGNTAIPYFNSDSRRNIGTEYWTSSADSDSWNMIHRVTSDGTFSTKSYSYVAPVVPAIRVG